MKHLKSYKIFESSSDIRLSKERSYKMVKKAFLIIKNDIKRTMSKRGIETKKIFGEGFGGSGDDNEWFWFDTLDDTQMVDYMVEEDTDVSELRLSFKMIVEAYSIIDVKEVANSIDKYNLTEISDFTNVYPDFKIRRTDSSKRLIEFYVEYDMYDIIQKMDRTFKDINENYTDNFKEDTDLVKVLGGLLDKIRRNKGLWEEFMTNIRLEEFEDSNIEHEEYYGNFEKMGKYWYVNTTFTEVSDDQFYYRDMKSQYVLNQLSKSTIKFIIDFIMEDEDVTDYINKDLFKNINESFTSRFRENGYSISKRNEDILRKMLISILDKIDEDDRDLFGELMEDMSENLSINGGFIRGIYKNFKKEWYLSHEEPGEPDPDQEIEYYHVESKFDELRVSTICDIIDYLMKDGRVSSLINDNLFRSINH